MLVVVVEVAHLGMDKMADDAGQDRQETAVGDGGDFGDVLVVVFDKLQMRQQAGEVGPTGKGFDLNQQAVQLAFRFNVRIYQVRQRLEIRLLQRAFRAS